MGEPIWVDGYDEGEGDGIFQPGDTWNDGNGNGQADTFNNDNLWMDEEGWIISNIFDLIQQETGIDDDLNGITDDCQPGSYIGGQWYSSFFGQSIEGITDCPD